MKDIIERDDIISLVNAFYERVKKDDTIGYIFQEIIGEDWSHHLPVMYQFWETVLLQKQGYTGNPVKKHVDIDQKILIADEHYIRWLQLWESTVDDMFAGANAIEIKKRASLMMQLIKMKVNMAREGRSSIM